MYIFLEQWKMVYRLFHLKRSHYYYYYYYYYTWTSCTKRRNRWQYGITAAVHVDKADALFEIGEAAV
jgi:hypothetical protein